MSTSVADLLTDLAVPEGLRLPVGVPTGLSDLDHLTGGMQPGLWVVGGEHGVGLGMWLTQLAGQAAVEHNVSTHLQSPRDDPRRLVARLLAAQSRVPLHHLEHDQARLTDQERERMGATAERLSASPLRLRLGDRAVTLSAWSVQAAGDARLLVVNDAHLLCDSFTSLAHDLRAAAVARDCTVVLGLPRRQVQSRDGTVRQPWDSEADVGIVLDRPDALDHESPRVGEIDLHVLRHQQGPVSVITAAFQGHFARIVNMQVPIFKPVPPTPRPR
ncbi:MAG: dnaB [Frankiales bacterium]|nr:dnaB [Frankiales bacterium]